MAITNLITSPDDLSATTETGGDASNPWLTVFKFGVASVQQFATGIADPDGGGDAIELQLPNVGTQDAESYIRQSESYLEDALFTLDETYRFDVAFRLNPSFPDVEQCQLQLDTRILTGTSIGRSIAFDLTDAGSVVALGGAELPNESYGSEDLGDGWFRLWIVFDYTFASGTPDGIRVWIRPVGGNLATEEPSTFPQRVYVYEPRVFLLSDLTTPDPVNAATFDAQRPEFYRDHLREHLPPGFAWTREPSATITQLLYAWGVEFFNVGERGMDLLREKDPRTTFELLTEWETLLGLPDPCVTSPSTDIDERRTEIVAKLTETGGQSIAFFVALAAALGFEVEIEEHSPFIADVSTAGESVEVSEVVFVWTAHASVNLTSSERELLECTFVKLKPAHSVVVFAYDIDAYVEESAVVGVIAPVPAIVFS